MAKSSLRFPRLKPNLKGKTFGVQNTLFYPIATAGVLLGGGGILWYANQQGYIDLSKLNFNLDFLNLPGANLSKAERVIFNVYPPVIKPFRRIKLRGSFEDNQGNAQPVSTGYYGIFENVQAGAFAKEGRLMVSRGVIGQGISNFDINVPTDNFRPGPYTVYVSNKPIIDDPLRGKEIELQLVGDKPLIIG